MANRKGVKVKRRRDVQIKKVKKYISKHIYSFVCGGALLLVLLIVIAVAIGISLHKTVNANSDSANNAGTQMTETKKDSKKEDKRDLTAPVISGTADKTFTLGDKIAYLSGITATDDVDGEVDVEVDKSAVDTDTPGTYEVTYKAVDAAGNVATKTANITIEKPAPVAGTYQALAEEILGNITTSSMSTGQKLRAIFDYAHNKIGYTGTPYDGSNWENEALLALTELKKSDYTGGDCFTYTSVDKALLEALGVKTMWLENENSPTGDHAWLLVDAGTGWYHFDSTRMRSGFSCFMKTDAEIQAYLDQGNYNYVRTVSKYPATPTTPYTY